MSDLQIQATRTTFTENEVFGTSCNACGHVEFERESSVWCKECGSRDIDSAEGCEIPHDDDHSTTATLTGTAPELARWMYERGLTVWDGGSTVYTDDGSHVVDYAEGLREELTVSGDADTLTAILDLIQAGKDALSDTNAQALTNADAVNDHDLYR